VRVVEKFDHWVQEGPFTAMDLGLYRIIYAVATLLTVSDIQWISAYPDSIIDAPPGPFQVISGFPSPTVLVVLEVLRSLALVLLAIGLWTRWVSIGVAALLLVTYGLTYSLGKIDHTILVVLTPLILSFTHWGRRVSIDGLLTRRATEPPQVQWPLRFLALLVGLSFFAAAWVKLTTGWLSPTTQAALGHSLVRFYGYDSTSWSVQWVASTSHYRFAWELIDWLTVAFEFAILLALPWWRAFRIALAGAVLFHLGVLAAMEIDFSFNVVVYGAFVSWAALSQPIRSTPIVKRTVARVTTMPVGPGVAVPIAVFVLALSAGAWFVTSSAPGIGAVSGVLIVLTGAAIGIGYLVRQTLLVTRRLYRPARA
jgi:uncharacterized membrane protein YphA (DoxX/SURF4 family)